MWEKIGPVFVNREKKILKRIPTRSNLIKASGSDNDIYLGNISQSQVVDYIREIFEIKNIYEFDNKKMLMDFYNYDVEIYANINNQGRINLRILGKERLGGMLKSYEDHFRKNVSVEDLYIVFDFYKKQIYFENEQ